MRVKLTTSILALSLIAGAGAAFADRDKDLNVPRDQWLNPAQISERLAAQGYKVNEIESDDGAYEVKLTDKSGTRIKAYAHPATGELLPGYGEKD